MYTATAVLIILKSLPSNHLKGLSCSQCILRLAKQAVLLEKEMNEISSGGKLKLTSLLNPCQLEHDVTTHSSLDSIAMLPQDCCSTLHIVSH